MVGTLHSFFSSSRPLPHPFAVSQEIRDRGSTFVAHIFRATTLDDARACIRHLKHVVHGSKPATHEIAAWRCMDLKPGSTGLSGPDDFELQRGYDDDGEKWAGNRVLKVMQDMAIIDAVVIVSRWYGGILLGPARFTHIETCAEEVCGEFKKSEEFQDCITTLTSLDDLLAQLRTQIKQGSTPSPSSDVVIDKDRERKRPDYSNLDLLKAKRLIVSREKSIKSCKSLLSKQQIPQTSKPCLHDTGSRS
ncbi:hypothetical protein AX15_006839 [Amanita polypyramis BW_CC]|nr:hypothetical protein AX15_006839 [Amanita polypyramis BW_CC]